jgi:Glycosyl transferase family 2
VIVPAYNRADLLRRSLESVWSQRPALPAEVLVIDDGSVDDTSQVAEAMGARVIRHAKNLGLSAARNTGLGASRYSWVALLDSDDEWLPHHMASLWPLRGDHVLVAGSALRCGSDPAEDWFAGPLTRRPLVLRSGDRLIYPGNIIPVSASMFRRELALRLGGFQSHDGHCEDFDLWLRLLERGTGVCSPTVSIVYHSHCGQMSNDLCAVEQAGAAAAEAHIRRTGGSRAPIERREAVAAWDNLRHAVYAKAYGQAARCAAQMIARPQRAIGLLGFLVVRVRTGRRNAELRRAGIGRR